MATVLLALDTSPHSAHAAEVAHRLFGDDATYLAVNVSAAAAPVLGAAGLGTAFPTPPVLWREVMLPDPDARALADATARHAAAAAGLEGAEAIGAVGDPATAILHLAVEHHVDVVVVGEHTRSWWDRLVSPSVVKEVLHDAVLPVLVVPSRHQGA